MRIAAKSKAVLSHRGDTNLELGRVHPSLNERDIMTRIVSTLAADPDFAELVDEFVSELPDRIELIQSALASDDREQLRRTAHQLKGACGGYGFPTLTDSAARLEHRIDEGVSLADLAVQIASFVAELSCATTH
jgi:HPt (histidine-containing phosphotransfer) domain-containing protein